MHKRGHGQAKRKTQAQPQQPQQPQYYKASQGRHINYTEKFMHGYLTGKGMSQEKAAKTAYYASKKPDNRLH